MGEQYLKIAKFYKVVMFIIMKNSSSRSNQDHAFQEKGLLIITCHRVRSVKAAVFISAE